MKTLPITESWLKTLYEILIIIYSKTNHPIISGVMAEQFHDNIISICVNRPYIGFLGQEQYPHTLQKGAILMQSIIDFHPFLDGNKRSALISTAFFLHWNGYDFVIPPDADDFTIEVAKGEKKINDVLYWLEKNSSVNIGSLINCIMCHLNAFIGKLVPMFMPFIERVTTIFLIPMGSMIYFGKKVIEDEKKQA